MTNRVSIDTAQRLKTAGWQHTLEPGDWVLLEGREWLVVGRHSRASIHVVLPSPNAAGTRLVYAASCLHLPSAEQIEASLMLEERWELLHDLLRTWAWSPKPRADVIAGRAEACAAAWLAAHPAEEKGEES